MITLLVATALLAGASDTALKGCSSHVNRPMARALLWSRTLDQAAMYVKKVQFRTNCAASGKYSGLYSFEPTGGSVESMRGVVAEKLVKDDMRLATALPALPIQREYSRPWFAATGRHVSMDEMATCIADTNPGGIIDLLRSPANTSGETVIFGGLEPSFKACLRTEFKLVGNRQIIRGALADALYQRMTGAAPLQSRTEQH